MNLITIATSSPLAFFVMFGRFTPLAFIAIPLILAYVITVIAKKTRNPQMRKFAYLPLLLGLLVGIAAQIQFNNEPMYMQFNDLGSKSEMLFWGVIIVPVLASVALFFSDRLSNRSIDSDL
ncbi:MAG: hypothetical protein KF836_10595 [Fimbriimonadaceae bacterium]|nr:hypothetical protein [Fimbriimonadaceae bacterium]